MSKETREKIFLAAARIINEQTVDNMTLEEVASEAGISKGGLLYHFPTKEDLVEGLVNYYETLFNQELEKEIEKLSGNRDRPLTAYVNATFNFSSLSHQISQGVIAASVYYPDLLAPVQKRLANFTTQYSRHIKDEDLAKVIRLAADGLWLEEIMELNTLTSEEKSKIKEKLNQLAEEVEV